MGTFEQEKKKMSCYLYNKPENLLIVQHRNLSLYGVNRKTMYARLTLGSLCQS